MVPPFWNEMAWLKRLQQLISTTIVRLCVYHDMRSASMLEGIVTVSDVCPYLSRQPLTPACSAECKKKGLKTAILLKQ